MTAARFSFLFMIGACGGGGASPDAAVDTGNGICGTSLRFVGEYVDWDNDKSFCAIANAQVTVQGTGTQKVTPLNGEIDLCIPDQPVTLLDITPPVTVPDCKTDKTHNYRLPTLAVASKAVIAAGGEWAGRTFVEGRETYNPAKAQVLVHVNGTPRAVSLDAAHAHGPIQAVANDTWAPGDTGYEVFIPDVDPAGGSATLSVAGGAVGEGSIPLVAGKLTTLAVIAN